MGDNETAIREPCANSSLAAERLGAVAAAVMPVTFNI
jgi:hypothetical protein